MGGENEKRLATGIFVAVIVMMLVAGYSSAILSDSHFDKDEASDQQPAVLESVDREFLNSIILICEDVRRHQLHGLFLICEVPE